MVVGQADDARAQLDMSGTLCGSGDKHFRRSDGFPASAVVLADPGLIKAEIIEPLQQLQVTLKGQRGVFTKRVEGGHENAKLQSRRKCHGVPSPFLISSLCVRIMGHPAGRCVSRAAQRLQAIITGYFWACGAWAMPLSWHACHSATYLRLTETEESPHDRLRPLPASAVRTPRPRHFTHDHQPSRGL